MTSPYYNYEILSPLYRIDDGVVVGIYSKRIKDAIRNRQWMRITCEGITNTISPKWIKANCKTFEKVYLRKDEPMKEYEVFLRRETAEEKLKKLCAELNL